MAKLGGSVASASLSNFPPVGQHTFEIKAVDYKEYESGAAGFEFKLFVVASDENDAAIGRTFFFNCVTQKKDGELNSIGAGDVKKIVAAAVSKEASEDSDFDTDDLIGTTFNAKLTVIEKEGQENARLSRHSAA